LSLGQPALHADVQAHDSGLVVRVYGCSAKNGGIACSRRRHSRRTKTFDSSQPRSSAGKRQRRRSMAIHRLRNPEILANGGNLADQGHSVHELATRSALVVVESGGIDWSRTRLKDAFTSPEVALALGYTGSAGEVPSLGRAHDRVRTPLLERLKNRYYCVAGNREYEHRHRSKVFTRTGPEAPSWSRHKGWRYFHKTATESDRTRIVE
jgi:hypothetical protein